MQSNKFSEHPDEEWRDVPDFPNYRISNYGKIYNKQTNKELKTSKNPRGGHLSVHVKNQSVSKRMFIHILVLETFVSKRPSDKHVCRHLDGNPENNYVGNLTWGTLIENILDRFENPNDDGIKLNKEMVIKIKEMLIDGKRPVDISRELNISAAIIMNIKQGHNWKTIGPDLSKYNIKRKRSPLDEETVRKIKKRIKEGYSNIEIGKEFNITKNCVSCIRCGYRFKWVK